MDGKENHRRKSSIVTSEAHRSGRASSSSACFVHSLLETQRRKVDSHADELDHRIGKADAVDPKGASTDVTSAMNSRLLTKKQLSDMAYGVRELSRRLGNIKLKLQVKRVFILTKAHDETLIEYTRELASWLLSSERTSLYTVCATPSTLRRLPLTFFSTALYSRRWSIINALIRKVSPEKTIAD